jgi:hypothetical protein
MKTSNGSRQRAVHRWRLAAAPVACIGVLASSAGASSPTDATPIGPLPAGPVMTVMVPRGQLVAVALPRQKASTGLVWRLARKVDSRVLRQLSEADVGPSVVVVFRAVGRGKATIVFALTRGESSSKALRAIRYKATIS